MPGRAAGGLAQFATGGLAQLAAGGLAQLASHLLAWAPLICRSLPAGGHGPIKAIEGAAAAAMTRPGGTDGCEAQQW